ncbi:hypothetical protein KI387_023317, partial [Taxus chinensis]
METEIMEGEQEEQEREQGLDDNNLSIDNMDIDLDALDFNFEEEEEDEEEEEEYTLRFQGEMDPLAFAENDHSGAQPYEQFQRLEYETLAARKRKQHQLNCDDHAKKAMQQDIFGASMDEIMEAANFGLGRREHRRKNKKSGRRKGEGPKLTPEVTKKVGEANLLYATGCYDEAIELLQEVIRLAPNVPDSYHTLALVYISIGDKTKATNFYMIAAHLTPKDSMLWKRLASWSMEQGNAGQLIYCLTKAMKADPEDMAIKWDRASLYVDLNDYHRAAEAFDQIAAYRPSDVEAWKMAAKMHHRSGHSQRAREVLEKLIDEHPSEADLTVVSFLAALHMENKTFSRAIQHIEHARMIYCSGQGLPPDLAIKAGICHAHLGNLEQAEKYFEDLHLEQAEELAESIIDVADAYMNLEHHHRALKYYCMLEGTPPFENVHLWLKIAQCHAALETYPDAINFYYKALDGMMDNVDVRLTLVSLLVDHDRTDEAIQLLLPPQQLEKSTNPTSTTDGRPWWSNGKIKKKLAQIYHAQGKVEPFVEAVASSIKETLYLETLNQKISTGKDICQIFSAIIHHHEDLEGKRLDIITIKAYTHPKYLKSSPTAPQEQTLKFPWGSFTGSVLNLSRDVILVPWVKTPRIVKREKCLQRCKDNFEQTGNEFECVNLDDRGEQDDVEENIKDCVKSPAVGNFLDACDSWLTGSFHVVNRFPIKKVVTDVSGTSVVIPLEDEESSFKVSFLSSEKQRIFFKFEGLPRDLKQDNKLKKKNLVWKYVTSKQGPGAKLFGRGNIVWTYNYCHLKFKSTYYRDKRHLLGLKCGLGACKSVNYAQRKICQEKTARPWDHGYFKVLVFLETGRSNCFRISEGYNDGCWERVDLTVKITGPIISFLWFADANQPILGEVYKGLEQSRAKTMVYVHSNLRLIYRMRDAWLNGGTKTSLLMMVILLRVTTNAELGLEIEEDGGQGGGIASDFDDFGLESITPNLYIRLTSSNFGFLAFG